MSEQQQGQKIDPQHSEKLKQAADEIKAILKSHDIGGVINLFEPGFTENVICIDPSWSVVAINEKNQLRIMEPLVHPEHPAQAKKRIADTVNMLANLRVGSMKIMMALNAAETNTRQHFGIVPPKVIPGTPNLIPGKNGQKFKG